MTRPEAHALLNSIREGANPSRREIDRALYATGDLVPPPSMAERSDERLVTRRAMGTWELLACGKAMAPAGPFDWLVAA